MAKNSETSESHRDPGKTPSSTGGSKKGKPVVLGSIIGAAVVVIAVVVLLVARSAGRDPVTFDYANLPRLGNAAAPVKIVEFGDFKCPACKYFDARVFPVLQRTYIDPGEVRFYFMNFPFLGPDSTTAAEAGLAIFHQKPSSFWDYYKAMYANQGDERTQWATPVFILRLATRDVPGINYTLLGQEIAGNKYRKEVQDQYDYGRRLGVSGTPTLFINGHEFLDFSSWPAFDAAIKKYR
jgi:protein-disulfide isomerase